MKKLIKRCGLWALAAVLFIGAIVFAISLTNDTSEPIEKESPVVLQVWGGVPADAGPNQVMQAFNEAFKEENIQAEYCYFPNDESGNKRMETTLLAGGSIDLYFTYTTRELEKRVINNMALDLSEYIEESGIDLEEYFGRDVFAYYVNGRPYSLPTKLDQYGITINKDMFDEAGIPIPTDWTFDEFREIAKKLSHGEGTERVYGMFFCTQQDISYVTTYLAARSLGGDPLYKNGGTETNFDNPVIHDVVQLVDNMMNVDHSAPTHVDSVTRKLTQESMFLTGKCAMTIGPWIIRSVKDQETYPHDFTTAFAPYPVASRSENNYAQGGLGDHLSICPSSRYQDEAWKFLQWYVTEGMIYMVEGGRVPAYKGFDQQEITDLLLKNANNTIDEETAKNVLIVPKENYAIPTITTRLSQISSVMNTHFEKIFIEEETVEEGLALAKKEGDAWLKSSS